ncbi:YgaP family membrane protein [Halopseudomonas yangmingensis]|uniref:Inner membrane protein YgaP-like transmembrane domain-containing protein n=1 Tax=Halopseudomonas yangmingensis TaxID=1720063 RepID=A0A1I4RC53_9GAMM|nr:DUF2892 domain-containing protein [Halopseudomonas yangmingensis]SFM49799.1 Protein of unknown function [Halopseudomonas yangmingensis]
MTINEGLRLMAGVFILISILLAHFVNPAWLLFTGFIALNLIQSAFTKWCPAMVMLKKIGLKQEKPVN